jgi:hypothetical protein
MLRKIMNYMIGFIMLFLVCGIIAQYYISQPTEPEELICHKGRLLARVGDDGTVYTKVKEFTCDYQKGMLIIEEEK